MKNNLKLSLILSILLSVWCQNQVSVDTDYTPLNPAYDSIKQIELKYNKYKEIIYKNISIEYPKCESIIKEMKCNNIDQWQSVIEELQQENENSEKSEIPFLLERKKMKVDRFSAILNQSEYEDQIHQNITENLSENQQRIRDAFYLIEEMYKIPKEQQIDFTQLKASQDSNEFNNTEPEEPPEPELLTGAPEATEEKEQTAAQILNSDVPDIAKEQLKTAKTEYDIADQSIQAQTTANLLRKFNSKMSETMGHVNDAYGARSGSLQKKKELIQGDILKVRVMAQNEVNKQTQNKEKIAQLQEQITNCEGMPTDILKDCNPIKVNASKLLTEIDIIQKRTLLLQTHIGEAVEQNVKQSEIQEHLEQKIDNKNQKEKQAVIDSYLKDPEIQYHEQKEPNELEPIHHLKDNLPEKEEEEGEQNATEEEAVTEEEGAEDNETNEAGF